MVESLRLRNICQISGICIGALALASFIYFTILYIELENSMHAILTSAVDRLKLFLTSASPTRTLRGSSKHARATELRPFAHLDTKVRKH